MRLAPLHVTLEVKQLPLERGVVRAHGDYFLRVRSGVRVRCIPPVLARVRVDCRRCRALLQLPRDLH